MRTIINKKNIFQVLVVLTIFIGIFSYVFINNTKILKAEEDTYSPNVKFNIYTSVQGTDGNWTEYKSYTDYYYLDGDYYYDKNIDDGYDDYINEPVADGIISYGETNVQTEDYRFVGIRTSLEDTQNTYLPYTLSFGMYPGYYDYSNNTFNSEVLDKSFDELTQDWICGATNGYEHCWIDHDLSNIQFYPNNDELGAEVNIYIKAERYQYDTKIYYLSDKSASELNGTLTVDGETHLAYFHYLGNFNNYNENSVNGLYCYHLIGDSDLYPQYVYTVNWESNENNFPMIYSGKQNVEVSLNVDNTNLKGLIVIPEYENQGGNTWEYKSTSNFNWNNSAYEIELSDFTANNSVNINNYSVNRLRHDTFSEIYDDLLVMFMEDDSSYITFDWNVPSDCSSTPTGVPSGAFSTSAIDELNNDYPISNYSLTGYTFAGWATSNNYDDSIDSLYSDYSDIPSENITLYGTWDVENYNYTVKLNFKMQDINGNYPTDYTELDLSDEYYYFQRQSGSNWNTIDSESILPGDRVMINYSKLQSDFGDFIVEQERDIIMSFSTSKTCSFNNQINTGSAIFNPATPEYSATVDENNNIINIYLTAKRQTIYVESLLCDWADPDTSNSGPYMHITWDGTLLAYEGDNVAKTFVNIQCSSTMNYYAMYIKSNNTAKYGSDIINSDQNSERRGYAYFKKIISGSSTSFKSEFMVYAGTTFTISFTDSSNNPLTFDDYGIVQYNVIQMNTQPKNSQYTANVYTDILTSEYETGVIDQSVSTKMTVTYNTSYPRYVLAYGVRELPEQTYDISYNLNDISDNYDVITETLPETANINETVTIPNPTLKGYTFTGWTINDTDTVVYNASGIYDNLNDTTDAITLTANWESIEVQVGFVLDTQPYYIYTMNEYNDTTFKQKYMGVVEYDGSKYIDIVTDTSYNGESFIDSDKVFIKGFDMVDIDVNTVLEDNDAFMSYINDVDVDGDLTEKYINPGYKITGYYIITDSDIKTAFNHKTGYTAPYISSNTIDINEKIIDIIEDCENNETIYITPKWESYKYKVDIYYSYQDVEGNWTSYYNMTDYQIFGDKYYMDSEFIDYDPTKLISEGSNNIINVGQSITGDFSEITDWENMYNLNRNYGAGINISQRFFMNPKNGGYLPKSYTGVPPEDKPFQDLYYYGLDGYYLSKSNSSVYYATVQRTKNSSGVVLDETKCKKTKVNNENYDFEIKVYFRFPRDTYYVGLTLIPENTVNEGEHLYTPYQISYDKNGTHCEYRINYDTGYYNIYKDENGNDLRFDATRGLEIPIYKGGSLELTNISVDNNHTYVGWGNYNTGPMANKDISQLTLGDSIDLGTIEPIQVGNTLYMPTIYIKAESHTENTYSLNIDGAHYDLSNIVCDDTGINKIVVNGETLWEHQCSVCGKTLLPNCALDSSICLGNYILDTYTISDYTYNGGSYPYWSVNAHLTYQCALCNSTYEKDQAMSIYKMNISVSNNPTDEELRTAFSEYIERYYNSTYIEHEIAN